MGALDLKEFEDWVLKNECFPFEDSIGNLCITVESEYESFGGERDARLNEAKEYGIDRLIRFYGKTYISSMSETSVPQQGSLPTPTELYNAAETPEFHISPRQCVRMRVLVKIPKDTFDEYTINRTNCDIDIPVEGYLSAFISVENYERDIDYVVASMEDFLPKMAKSDKYMTNINIVQEIKRLKRVKNTIKRYFNLNSVTPIATKEEECEPDVKSLMEIGFRYSYKPAFAAIDGSKHSIGYDCFLEASNLNHPTTANYLTQLGNMSSALTKQLSPDFDIFEFLVQHTYPTPIIDTKNDHMDGLEKYNDNGNLFSFANLAKLVTLDLDKKSCKTGEERSNEKSILMDAGTRASIANAARESRDFIGNMSLSTSGMGELRETLNSMKDTSAPEALNKIIDDIWERVNWGCVLEESLQCMLEAAITKMGTAVFNDPDLGQFFSADGAIEGIFGLCPREDSCENEELQLRYSLPVFQGVSIPSNFPTTDYLSKSIDLALKNLYDVLINSYVSLILGILDNMCKMISLLGCGGVDKIKNLFSEGFTSWMSQTIGIDVSELDDGKAWADASMSAGGSGYMGVIGNLVTKTAGSMDSNGNWVWGGSAIAATSETGVLLNLPNPSTGKVEKVLVSPEAIYNVISGIRNATEDLEAVLTQEEQTNMYKANATTPVVNLAFNCVTRNGDSVFETPQDLVDTFSSLGKMVRGNLLDIPDTESPVITSICDLGDGSDQEILRKAILKDKDSILSDLEIEEILSKEKQRCAEKIKTAHKALKAFQDGSIAPDFPSIYGSEDSLISEPPPVILDAMRLVCGELYSSTVNNFNVSMMSYTPLWKTETPVSTSEEEEFENIDFPSFAKLARKMMRKNDDKSLSLNLTVDDSLTTLGYKINPLSERFVTEVVPAEPTESYLGLYEWDGDEDGGLPDGFDAGRYSGDWWRNNSGPDDERFATLIRDAGIRYVDLSEDDFALLSLEAFAVFIAVSGFIIAAILIPAFGAALSALWYSTLTTLTAFIPGLGAASAVISSGLLTLGVSFGAVILTAPAIALAVTLGGLLASYLLLKELLVNSWEVAVWAIAKWDSLKDKSNFKTEIDCAYDSGELPKKEYEDLEPVVDELAEALQEASDINQWQAMQQIADYLEEIDNENGSPERAFDISSLLVERNDTVTTELVLKSEVAGANTFGDGRIRMHTVAYIRETPITSEETNLERTEGFSEVITSFERRGVRSDTSFAKEGFTKPSDMDFNKPISLQAIYDSGTSLSEYDRIENKISNYRMENESSLLLGRKIAEPNFLDTRYSSTIDAPDKSIMELWKSQVNNGSELQEHHLKLQEIIEQSGLTTVNEDNVKSLYEDVWKDCVERMAQRVYYNRMYLDEYLNALELEYPKQDVLGYNKVRDESVGLMSSIMKLESSNDSYCDALTPISRSGSITGLRLMIRIFIVERVLNSLQVFDTFNTDFMTSDMFKKAVFDDIKVETDKYQNSFSVTLDDEIFSDMKETASKYFEIQGLLGNEVPEINTDKEAILEIIKMEIDDINKTIGSQIRLDTLYHSSTWDEFVFDVLLTEGDYKSGEDPATGEIREYFAPSVLDPFFAQTSVQQEDGIWIYRAELQYSDSSGMFGSGITVPIIRAECPGSDPGETAAGCDEAETVVNYDKVKKLLFDNEIYQDLISYVFPLKDAATLLSTYHLSAITDPAVFSATTGGKHVTDLFSETKFSTLQAFLACVHGEGETPYIDPFLEKLKT